MPLQDHFTRQIDSIRDFMAAPDTSLARLEYAAEAEPVVRRILLGLHDEESAHSMIFCDAPFESDPQYSEQCLQWVVESNEDARQELAEHDVHLPPPPRQRNQAAFAEYLCATRAALPEGVGGYTVVLAPERVADDQAFAAWVEGVARRTTAPGAKLLVLDASEVARLQGVEDRSQRACRLEINFGAEGVEAKLRKDLAGDQLSPEERGQYLALASAYDAARQSFPEAIAGLQEALPLLAEHGQPAEYANALYSLGTAHIRAKQATEAEAALAQAAQVCLENALSPLLALVLTNLGVALQALDRIEEAVESFNAAVATFEGLGHLPGKALSLDAKAATLAAAEQNAQAEQAWLDALATYDEVTSEQFAAQRQAACKELRSKLKAFYESTEQHEKAAALKG